ARWHKVFDFTIQLLIILSLITFSVETLPDLDPVTRQWLRYVEVFTVSVFTVEYIVRLIVAKKKLKFIFSFFGMVDLISILPFYLTTGVDLRSFRAFRLLRLLRALKIIRYSKAIRQFHNALMIARDEIILYLFITFLLLYFAAVGIYYFEHEAQPEVFSSIFNSLWWAVATLTTVGYGDVYPITAGGRIFTFFVLLIGLGVVSVPAGLVSSAFSQARDLED
ncbi:MAG: ion transporter, partial [Cyanobacteria bacterium J06631_2]